MHIVPETWSSIFSAAVKREAMGIFEIAHVVALGGVFSMFSNVEWYSSLME